MKDAEDNSTGSQEPAAGELSTEEGLAALRQILVGPERKELEEVRAELEAKELEAAEVGRVLPDAIRMRAQQDGRLADALTPTIEDAIEGSVRRNPQVLADAIFPLMGPAIRRSIRQTLATFLEGLNRSLEHSFSAQGLRWRLEAYRTGKPFAEIVLKHSLVFRVEQVFLIHREAAILLEHVTAPTAEVTDPEMISSMLGVIHDFVNDSFSPKSEQGLTRTDFGDFVIEVAQGPEAILACVVEGLPRTGLRTRMDEVLEQIHAERADDLHAFTGDVAPFAAAQPLMEQCFMEQRAETKKKGGMRPGAVIAGLVLLAVSVLATMWLVRSVVRGRVWASVVEEVSTEPGFVLLSSESEDGRYTLRGLRDPLARDPLEIFAASGLDPDLVDATWEPYYSVEPAFVRGRVLALLEPPDTVRVALEDGVLVVDGSADHAWVRRAQASLVSVPGVAGVRLDVDDLDLETARSRARAVGRHTLGFAPGAMDVDASDPGLVALKNDLDELVRAVETAEASLAIVVTGFRAAEEHEGLDRARAESLQRHLTSVLGEGAWIQASAGGVGEAVAPQMGRKATLRVRLVDDHSAREESR